MYCTECRLGESPVGSTFCIWCGKRSLRPRRKHNQYTILELLPGSVYYREGSWWLKINPREHIPVTQTSGQIVAAGDARLFDADELVEY